MQEYKGPMSSRVLKRQKRMGPFTVSSTDNRIVSLEVLAVSTVSGGRGAYGCVLGKYDGQIFPFFCVGPVVDQIHSYTGRHVSCIVEMKTLTEPFSVEPVSATFFTILSILQQSDHGVG